LSSICRTLAVPYRDPGIEVRPDTNVRYLKRWQHSRVAPVHPRVFVHRFRFERRLAALGFGYTLRDVTP
jgi:hypothetical protein